MGWQHFISLGIVAAVVGVMLWIRFRPRKFSLERDTHCGCSSPSDSGPRNSIIYRARRGERPQVIVKMK